MKRYPVAYVEWVDAAIVQGVWTTRKPALKRGRRLATRPIRSAGLLLDQCPESITLGLSHNPNNRDVAMVFVIPRGCIRTLTLWTGEGEVTGT